MLKSERRAVGAALVASACATLLAECCKKKSLSAALIAVCAAEGVFGLYLLDEDKVLTNKVKAAAGTVKEKSATVASTVKTKSGAVVSTVKEKSGAAVTAVKEKSGAVVDAVKETSQAVAEKVKKAVRLPVAGEDEDFLAEDELLDIEEAITDDLCADEE